MKSDKKENATFANNLKYYVELSGKEQKDICDELGIFEASFSGYINGKNFPRLKTVQAIADYFGCSMSDLIENKEKNHGEEQRKLFQKEWDKHFGDLIITKDEFAQIIGFVDYLVSKRK